MREKIRDNASVLLFAALMALAALLFLADLGSEPFLDYDEAAYARIVEETVGSGDVLTLKFIGENWFDKPPLFYWLAAASGAAFGQAEFAYRLPSALSGIAAVALAWLIMREFTKSPFWPAFAGFALLTTGAFLSAGRQARVDMLVTAALLFSFYASLRAARDPRWHVAFGAGVGVALMTKGVIGLLAYPFMAVAALSLRRFGWLRSGWFWAGQAVAAAIALPWHAYMSLAHGWKFWDWYILTHVVKRYGSNLFENGTDALTYPKYLLAWAAPWVLLFVGIALVFAVGRKKLDASSRRPLAAFLGNALLVFAIFEAAETKVPFYLVPMYPFVSLFIALFLASAWSLGGKARFLRAIAAALAVMSLGALTAAVDRGFFLDDSLDVENRQAYDEREIGLILRGGEGTVRFADPFYWETVRYYSRGRDLAQLDGSAFGEEFYLVVPAKTAREAPYYRSLVRASEALYRMRKR